MAEKKKNAKMANRNVGVEVIKDDGDKYAVVRDGLRVYGGRGVALGEAVRLATQLETGAGISKIENGALVPGSVTDGEFLPFTGAAA
jgi:hypothetical protein